MKLWQRYLNLSLLNKTLTKYDGPIACCRRSTNDGGCPPTLGYHDGWPEEGTFRPNHDHLLQPHRHQVLQLRQPGTHHRPEEPRQAVDVVHYPLVSWIRTLLIHPILHGLLRGRQPFVLDLWKRRRHQDGPVRPNSFFWIDSNNFRRE